ncbi:MAG: SDR family oxidoreductase [Chromatocurvus sp.]
MRDSMGYFTGKSAVITGAGSGIGRALARALNGEGCALYLSDIDEAALAATVSSLPHPGVPVDQRRVDVAAKDAMDRWAKDINAQRTAGVDIVINNAGVAYSARVDACDYAEVQWLMSINFWGVVHGTLAFLPLLKAAPRGHLVNLSSILGIIGVPTQSAYNAAKFAVRGYTESLRQELAGSSVHVCCVHPGGVSTNIARNSRGGAPGVTANDRAAQFEPFARTTPEAAAAQIIRAIERGQPRLLIGRDARFVDLLARLFPARYPRLLPGLGQLGQSPE